MGHGVLSGLRVVELAHPHTEYAGLLWAACGAEVFLVEPPAGAASRRRRPRLPNAGESPRGGIPFLARNANKKSVVIDPRDAADVALLERLCERADVVFDADGSPFQAIAAAAAAPARVAVTDRLGLGASSIVSFAASGGLASSGWPHQPPCNAPAWLAFDGAGAYAAVMGMVAVMARRGGGVHIRYEIPLEEAAVAAITPWTRLLHSHDMQANGQGTVTARLGPNAFPIHKVKDGYVRTVAATSRQWEALVALLGHPEELAGPWDDVAFRVQNVDALRMICDGLMAERTVEELFNGGQKLGVTITPVNSLKSFARDPHVRARGILTAVDDPEFGGMEVVRAPFRMLPEEHNAPFAPAPGLGEHQDAARAIAAAPAPSLPSPVAGFDVEQPLRGLRILELGVGAVVPEAASLIALLGAEVIKVESAVHFDFLRAAGGPEADVNASALFNQLNLGVQSFAVDLSKPEGVALLKRLAARCDGVMENMRGLVAARWGLDYESTLELKPDMVYLGSQGLGRGPYDGYQTYGPNLQAFSGVTHQWAHPDDPFPTGGALNHPDHIAGKQALLPFLAALHRRDAGGCFVDATQVEGAAYLIGDRFLAQHHTADDLPPAGNRSPDMAPHGCYPCQPEGEGDDAKERWVAIAVEDDAQWARFAALVHEGWTADSGYQKAAGRLARAAELDGHLAAWTAAQSVAEVERKLRGAQVPVSRVVTGDDMAAQDTGFFPAVAHPIAGTHRYTALPVRDGTGRRPATRRPPLLGEHTERVLLRLLELDGEEVASLMAEGVVGH